ncbi:MAG TPA: hypothetical protein VMJ30_03200 [Gemmatimonadales bacterium]|nr:hypothetical protein [Gemmatimonadales bacterium]
MHAHTILAVSLLLVDLIASPPLNAQGPTGRAFCIADPNSPTAYVTPVFDDKLKAGSAYRSKVMSYEFAQYVKGRFGSQTSDPLSASCQSYVDAAQAEVGKQVYEKPVVDSKRKLVMVEWGYRPDPAEVQFSYTAVRTDANEPQLPRGPNDRGYCVTEQFPGPLYHSAVFPAPAAINVAEWQIAWMKYLAAQYGYKGEVYCSDGSRGNATRMMAARVEGARAGGRKVIDTGWQYQKQVVEGPKPDPDPEPVKAAGAAAAAAPPQVRDIAAKDGAAALTTCQNDRMVSGAFDCYSMQRAIYNYRMAHPPTGGEPLEVLLVNDRFDCTQCFDANKTEMWASNRAMSNGYTLDKSQCVGPKFVTLLKAKPYVNRVGELFNEAMKGCPK